LLNHVKSGISPVTLFDLAIQGLRPNKRIKGYRLLGYTNLETIE
jgi:hypothetical protein